MGNSLTASTVIAGPAVIEEPTTTIVVYPESSVRVTTSGNYWAQVT
jgi:N-methylhydantoinase A